MKTIGLIGGMSWESTQTYYQLINETVKNELGGLHSAQCLLYSVNFDEIEKLQRTHQWDLAGEQLATIAATLEQAGADLIILCTNTMHKVAPAIEAAITIPFLHIAQVTADALQANNINKVALLGTQYTMEEDFYKSHLIDSGIEVLIPEAEERREMNRIIFDELCLGQIIPSSKQKVLSMVNQLIEQGAQGVILGCTEIGMLIQQVDTPLPVFDTTILHAQKVAILAIES